MAAKPEDYLKNEKWVKRIEASFKDTSKDGYLSREELYTTADKLAEAVPDCPKEVAKLRKVIGEYCNDFGIPEGGKVDKDKFIQLSAAFVVEQMNVAAKGRETGIEKFDNAAFDVVDRNHDGTISWEEYKTMMAAYNMSEEAARVSFDMLDKNKDGKIERKEFHDSNHKFWCSLEERADGLFGGDY